MDYQFPSELLSLFNTSIQVVAVKVMQEMEEVETDQFLYEFNVMANTNSPYVAEVYGIVLEPALCIVMKYFEKGSLYHLLSVSDFSLKALILN